MDLQVICLHGLGLLTFYRIVPIVPSVRLGNLLSQPISVLSGVPRGSVIGPTLFLLFVNDVQSISLITLLFRSSYMLMILNYILVIILHHPVMIYLLLSIDYMTGVLGPTWQLTIAVQKCFTCRICSDRLSSLFQGQTYKINDTILPAVESVRDLGVIVDHHLKFDAHISLAVRKAMIRSRLIRSRLILKCFFSRNKNLLLKA